MARLTAPRPSPFRCSRFSRRDGPRQTLALEPRLEPEIDIAMECLRHGTPFLGLPGELLKLGSVDPADASAHGERDACDAGARNELDLGSRLQLLYLVAGLG